VIVLLSRGEPGEVIAVANADETGTQLGDDRSLPGVDPSPSGDRVNAYQRTPILPSVNMVEWEIVLLCSRHLDASLQVIARRKVGDLRLVCLWR
jgi:hypothetical protein